MQPPRKNGSLCFMISLLFSLNDFFQKKSLLLKWSECCSVVSNSLRPHGLYSPWNSPGQKTREGSHSLLQGIFPTQRSNPGLPHCGQILYHLSLQGNFIGEVKLSYKDAIVITKFYSLRKTTFIKTSVSSSVWIGLYLSIIIHCVKFFGYLWICSYQTLTFRIQC